MTRRRGLRWRVKAWSEYSRPDGFPPAPALWDAYCPGIPRIVGPFDTAAAAQAEVDRRNAREATRQEAPIAAVA